MSFDGTILIVNFNSGTYLAACLESIAAHTPLARTLAPRRAYIYELTKRP